jgi:soluble P-type ATPase
MIIVEIPGRPKLTVEHLVLDVNGTLAQAGQLVGGVVDRLQSLRKILEIHLLTADTHGRQSEMIRPSTLLDTASCLAKTRLNRRLVTSTS